MITPKPINAFMRLGKGTIEQAAWSPDGNTLAVSGSQGIWLYSADDWQQPPRLLESDQRYKALAFSPDNHTVAASTDIHRPRIDLWDTQTGERTAQFAASGHEIWRLAFNHDGTLLASGDTGGEICLWDIATKTEKVRLQHPVDRDAGNGNPVTHFLFLPDKPLLVACYYGGSVRVWNLDEGSVLTILEHFAGPTLTAAFVQNQLVTVSNFSNDLWLRWLGLDVESPKAIHTEAELEILGSYNPEIPADVIFTGHTDTIVATDFNPACTHLVSADLDNSLRVWNLETRTLEAVLPEDAYHRPIDLAFHPNGEWVASTGEDARIHIIPLSNPAEQHVIEGHVGQVWDMALSPDENLIAAGTGHGDVYLWNVRDEQSTLLTGHTNSVSQVAFDSQQDILASGSWDGSVRLWDAKTGAEKAVFKEKGGNFWTISLSPNGQWVAAAGKPAPIYIWNTQSQQKHAALFGHTKLVRWVQFISDDVLVSVSDDGTVRLWDNRSGTSLAVLGKETTDYNACKSVALSADGKLLVYSHFSYKESGVTIWDLDTQAVWTTLSPTWTPEAMTFSADRKYLLTASLTSITLYDLENNRNIQEFYHLDVEREHMRGANAVAFHPSDKVFAATSVYGNIRLWHVETYEEIAVLSGHTFGWMKLRFSADGKTLYSGSRDGTIRLWNLSDMT